MSRVQALSDYAARASRARRCGRECTDGSPCQNLVDTPGDACWIDSHQDAPRVDGGPEDPAMADAPEWFPRAFHAALIVAKTLAVFIPSYLGLSGGLADLIGHALALALFVAFSMAVAWAWDALAERGQTSGPSPGENTGG